MDRPCSWNKIRLSPPTPTVFILLPVCSALPSWWPTHDTPGSWSFYVTPRFTAYIPFVGTGPLRAAIPATGATWAGLAPRPYPVSGPGPGRSERTNSLYSIPAGGHWASIRALLLKGSLLLYKTAVSSIRYLHVEMISFHSESASL